MALTSRPLKHKSWLMLTSNTSAHYKQTPYLRGDRVVVKPVRLIDIIHKRFRSFIFPTEIRRFRKGIAITAFKSSCEQDPQRNKAVNVVVNSVERRETRYPLKYHLKGETERQFWNNLQLQSWKTLQVCVCVPRSVNEDYANAVAKGIYEMWAPFSGKITGFGNTSFLKAKLHRR